MLPVLKRSLIRAFIPCFVQVIDSVISTCAEYSYEKMMERCEEIESSGQYCWRSGRFSAKKYLDALPRTQKKAKREIGVTDTSIHDSALPDNS